MAVVLKSADKMSKAELISLVKTLRKRIAKLQGEVDKCKAAPANAPTRYDVVHVTQGEDTVSELTPQDAEAHAIGEAATKELARRAPAGRQRRRIDAAKGGTLEPVFPWEKK